MYEDLIVETGLGKMFSRLTPLTAEELTKIRARYPDAPDDYLAFVEEIGWGEVQGRTLMLYSGFALPTEVFDAPAAVPLSGLLIFGDDMAGYCFAFNPQEDWRVMGIDSATGDVEGVSHDFGSFIRDWASGS